MSKLSPAQIKAIRDQVAAGHPCPLCKVRITPDEVTRMDSNLQRCPHCFRIFAVASAGSGLTNPDPRHTW